MLSKKLLEIAKQRTNFNDQKGASLVEYGLLVALIAVVCILAMTNLGQTISGKFVAITNSLLGI